MMKTGCPPGQSYNPFENRCDIRINHATCNPPFNMKWDRYLLMHNPDLLRYGKLNNKSSEQIFLTHMLNTVSNRVVLIVSDGILANPGYKDYRGNLIKAGFPQAVISLPRKIYRNTGTKTSIIVLDKHPTPAQKEQVFMAIYHDDDVEKKRKYVTVKQEAIDDCLKAYFKFREGGGET